EGFHLSAWPLTARSVRRPRYTEAATRQSRDRRRAVSRYCFRACTNPLLVTRTEQRWPRWPLLSTREIDLRRLAVYHPGRECSDSGDRISTICHAQGGYVGWSGRGRLPAASLCARISAIWPSFFSISLAMRFGRLSADHRFSGCSP